MTQVHVIVLPALMEVHVWFLALHSPVSVQLDSLEHFVKRPSVRIYMYKFSGQFYQTGIVRTCIQMYLRKFSSVVSLLSLCLY